MCFLQSSQQGTVKFDPEGKDYDYETAKKYGLKPADVEDDTVPHWPSRAPLSADEAKALELPPDSGVLLKGRSHPTFDKGVKVDEGLGYRLVKKGARYYTVKDEEKN